MAGYQRKRWFFFGNQVVSEKEGDRTSHLVVKEQTSEAFMSHFEAFIASNMWSALVLDCFVSTNGLWHNMCKITL